MTKQKTSKTDPVEYLNKGISAISVQGFKSLANECQIEIRPLTILAGANSSGKSSIMQPLLLMKQTLEVGYDPGPLLLNGPNAKFTSIEQFISHSQKDTDRQGFSVEIEQSKRIKDKVVFSLNEDQTLTIRDTIFNRIVEGKDNRSLHLKPNQPTEDLEKAIHNFFPENKEWPKWPEEFKWVVYEKRCFLDATLEYDGEEIPWPDIYKRMFSSSAVKELRHMIHVPGLRGNPERVYRRTATGPDFPGTFEHYVATIVAQWQEKKEIRLESLEMMLEDLGLTWKISAEGVNDTQIELQVGRLPKARRRGGGEDLVNLADVGFGVSQVLPVLVALLIAESGQLVYLEQPELHLHPRAQYALAEILAKTAKRGVKLVVETHSELLLLKVQTLVAEGNIDSDLVKLHWFSRDSEDGATSIKSADLDENGAFGDWPQDFGDVELMAEGAYLDAVEEKSKNYGKDATSAIGD